MNRDSIDGVWLIIGKNNCLSIL